MEKRKENSEHTFCPQPPPLTSMWTRNSALVDNNNLSCLVQKQPFFLRFEGKKPLGAVLSPTPPVPLECNVKQPPIGHPPSSSFAIGTSLGEHYVKIFNAPNAHKPNTQENPTLMPPKNH